MSKFLTFFLLLVLLATQLNAASKKKKKQPNVVVIFIDDMGYADASCYGNPLMETPNIDNLADNGIQFTNFYVNSPISSPSRVALLTGQYPMKHRIHSFIASSERNEKRSMAHFLNPEAPSLARILQKRGYATAHFGKWHMGGGRDVDWAPRPQEYGFDQSLVSFEGLGDRILEHDSWLCDRSAALGKGKITRVHKYEKTRIYVDSALSFAARHQDQPFYMNLWPNDVHDPHRPMPGVVEKYKDVTDNPYQQDFLAVLEEMDEQIGRFVHGLQEQELMEETIIIFTSDNGPTDWPRYYRNGHTPPGFTGPFFGRKWSLYEGGIRMPFIVRWDGQVPEGEKDQKTVMAAMDLLPTICSLTGTPLPEGVRPDGRDMSQAILGKPMDRAEPVMWEYASAPGGSIQPAKEAYRSPSLAIRQGKWKLLINADSTDLELYNLYTDPREQNSLVEQKQQLAGELAEKVLNWRRSMPVEIRK